MITIPVMKPCFHVICRTCVEELVHPSKQCVVCDHEVETGVDILELKREGLRVILVSRQSILSGSNHHLGSPIGTGFAAGGLAETSKTGVSFQG
jgi:nitric oxide synthase-interacting protein